MSEFNENNPCIDFHSHIYPQTSFVQKIPGPYLEKIKSVSKYYSRLSHTIQQKIHLAPNIIREKFDPLLLSFTLPSLAISSSAEDLALEMRQQSVKYAVVAAHPPLITNTFIISESKKNQNFLPCLTLTDLNDEDDFFEMRNLINPTYLLKINPMATALDLKSEKVQQILDFWNKKSWPVLIHTGALYSSFFNNPELGNIENFSEIVSRYSDIKFILLHMNIFKPYDALEFCHKFENTFVTTSWQSPELVTVASHKIGSERILFSSDWPLLGNNIEIRKNLILNLNSKKYLSDIETENILFKNAQGILENYFSKKL
jgi:hypothetical protein